ncbi:L-lactate dehydrogenase [Lactobacillus corticis]|uniref:L-2-hydroxyisocaproate dehydrogenase n=1 Tax=Lactobacillus corticis TaxID=2201249 RepID=A0A916QIH7_9LACO|nr:L-lactate dehydrogenase [Lactobacillus corticis]GFZ26692.1 L-2-hydroxyisocaproate dehydrogenase [Lactobacillus corticis]
MRKVGIIGMGHVGATVAFDLFTHGYVDELVLLDKNEAKAEAEYNDLSDTLARNDYYVKLKFGKWDDLRDADIIVTAFGDIKASVESGDRFAELPINMKNAKEVGAKIKASGFNGILINISNPCDAVSAVLQKVTGLSKDQVFGTGTFLDTARMQRIVGEKLHENPKNVEGWVLGEHGSSQFTAWSTLRVNNRIAAQLFDEQTQQELSDQPNKNSFKVARGKGYTSYAIATCAVKLVQAVFTNARMYEPVSVYLPEYKTYVGYPAIIGSDGIEEVLKLQLTSSEREKLAGSAEKIKHNLEKYAD